MIPWIQVYSNILTHDKTYALAQKLKIQNYGAVGIMVGLWCWAAVNAPDGDLTGYPPKALSDAVGWNKRCGSLYEALIEVGLLEETDGGRTMIRNWEKYAALLIDMMEKQKQKTKERVKRYRDKKKTMETIPCNVTCNDVFNATETLCNASTPPYITNKDLDVDDAILLNRAREIQLVDYVDCVDCVDNYVVVIPTNAKTEVEKLSERYFKRFFNRKPTLEDVAWTWLRVREQAENGEWRISSDKVEMLEYAFHEASVANALNINYINGIYQNFFRRGLDTMDDVVRFDFERDKANGKI